MIALGIETSGLRGGIALARCEAGGGEPQVLAERVLEPEGGMRHGKALVPAIATVLEEAGLGRQDLGLIVCGTGPGSYTSLRTGLATGRALAFALRIPVHAVASFDALVAGVAAARPAAARSALVAVDAYRGEVYVGRYRLAAGGVLERTGPITSAPPDQAAAGLEPPVWVLGSGPLRYPEAFPEGSSLLAPAALATPSAAALTRLGLKAWLGGERHTPKDVLPLYLRPSLPAPG